MSNETDKNDDIRSTLASAMAGDLGGGDGTAATTATTTSAATEDTSQQQATTTAATPPERQETDGRQRDELGRFKPGEQQATAKPLTQQRETLTIKPKTDETAQQAKPGEQQPKTAQTPKELADELQHGAPPPIDWKGDAKVDWKRLTPAIQRSISETVESLKAASADVAPVKELIDANRQLLVNEAGSVQEGVRQLFAFHRLSLEKPVELCSYILQRRGIDPAKVFATGQPQQQEQQPGTQQQAPDINSIVTQAVQRAVQPFLAQQQHTESQQYVSQIQAFAADADAHPYFNDVKAHMAALLRGGLAENLQQAYDQAVRAHPAIWPQVQARVAEDAANAKAAEVAAAQAAQRASTSGSPAPGATSTPAMGGSDGSIRGDLMAAMQARSGAV